MKSIASMVKRLLFFVAFAYPNAGVSMEGTGLQTCVAVDLVGRWKVGEDSPANDRLDVRSAEAVFFAPIDHIFDGNLSLAAHKESGVSIVEVHEATISSSKLVPRSTIKMGQLFPAIGRLGRAHQHDWPFISAPKVHVALFDKENIVDTGLEYAYVLPTGLYLDVTAGVTNGWTYGHSHVEGKRPRQPTHYTRVSTYASLPSSGGLALGLNYLGRRAAEGEDKRIAGLDLTAKWRQGNYLAFLLQSEAWIQTTKPLVGDAEKLLGSYVYAQYGVTSQLGAGMRVDYFTIQSLQDATGEKTGNAEVAVVPTITYKASEFSTLRLAYIHDVDTLDGRDHETKRSVETQATFIIGAHPAHEF